MTLRLESCLSQVLTIIDSIWKFENIYLSVLFWSTYSENRLKMGSKAVYFVLNFAVYIRPCVCRFLYHCVCMCACVCNCARVRACVRRCVSLCVCVFVLLCVCLCLFELGRWCCSMQRWIGSLCLSLQLCLCSCVCVLLCVLVCVCALVLHCVFVCVFVLVWEKGDVVQCNVGW